MASAHLGIILDSSVLIAAERRNRNAAQTIRGIQQLIGPVPLILSAITVAEIGHGIYRADTPERQKARRAFLDELKATIPIHPITEATAEIAARIGAEEARKGNMLPLADLLIGASALELGYSVATSNLRDFRRIPGLKIEHL